MDQRPHAAGDAILNFLMEIRRLAELAEERRRADLEGKPTPGPTGSAQEGNGQEPASELASARERLKGAVRRIGVDTAVKGWMPDMMRYLSEYGYEEITPLLSVPLGKLDAAQLGAIEQAMLKYNASPSAPALPHQNPFADETLSRDAVADAPKEKKRPEAGTITARS